MPRTSKSLMTIIGVTRRWSVAAERRPRSHTQCIAAAGVSPRAPGGGGEPRAARLDARGRSAPPPRASPALPQRRARSSAPALSAAERPRLRPVFLWARQLDGTVQEVRCEDYDPRNRIRIARTASGWRVIPRTEIYNSIRVSAPEPPARRERRRRRRRARSLRRAPPEPPRAAPSAAWLQPDLESHIPSHTIAVPRPPAEPTPLDNLLAVAELEFNQQRGDLDDPAPFSFLRAEEVARDVMSFELGEAKPPEEMFYERKAPPDRPEEYPGDLVAHKDLFETISEAHYLPELSGPHDEALLESLVEKGCEDNQILGQTLDKLAHLVHGTGEYAEEEEDMLLGGAPVADLIDRLEQTLEDPARSSITAAQGLLHLHGDRASPPERRPPDERAYTTDRMYGDVSEENGSCEIKTLAATEMQKEVDPTHEDYDQNMEKNLENSVATSEANYNIDSVSETNGEYDDAQMHSIPDQSEISSNEPQTDNLGPQVGDQIHPNINESEEGKDDDNYEEKKDAANHLDYCKESREAMSNNEDVGPTDLSIKHVEQINSMRETLASDTEASNTEDNLSVKSDEQPKDLTVHRRLPSPHASPRRTDVPRAPSRESDAMQSPQPSGIPAVPSSPEIFNMPLSKSKQTVFLESLLSSPSPKMYTSEVTITKQQCEPLNLGKHRKSASPTVSSCSDEMKKMNKEFGEPQEKKSRHESTDDPAKSTRKSHDRREGGKSYDECSPLKQFQILKSSPDFNIPDPLLIPKDKLNKILENPVREIPGLLIQRPELRLPQAFAFPAVLQDPDILVISLSQLESILVNEEKSEPAPRSKETKQTPTPRSAPGEKTSTSQSEPAGRPKPIPSMDALAGDIDAATSAALNQMLWLPYISQLEAMAACSQNVDFIKALNSSGHPAGYPDLSQMFNPGARFPGPSGFPVAPPVDYDGRLQYAMWQEAANHAASQAARAKTAEQKEAKAGDVQNPYVHSTKSHGSKSGARGPGGYVRPQYAPYPPRPPPGLQVPYFPGRARGPPSPYYPGYGHKGEARQESPRPRISVKSLQNLLEPGARRRRRDEPEVGSTTPGEPPPHDPAAYHLWHPLFGNQKNYNSPWSWTTVTATGD